MTRALVGQFFHEGNAFNPVPTEASDFTVLRGADLVTELSGSGSILGGILAECSRLGIEAIPTIAANARPGGAVVHAVFEGVLADLLAAARQAKPDMVLLELHGASFTLEESDPEGRILSELRRLLGPDCVIAAGLDLHAHVTDRMLVSANVVTACKHNPHDDFPETGHRVAILATQALAGKIQPQMAVARVPMLLAGNTETHSGPLRDAHRVARDAVAADSQLLDVSIFNCQPFLDVPNPAQVVLTVADEHTDSALTLCQDIADLLWQRRSEFNNDFPPIEDAIAIMEADVERRPFVVSDYGDRVLAGATGDSAAILAALLRTGSTLRAAIPIVAPGVASNCHELGEAARFTGQVGSAVSPLFSPVLIKGTIKYLGDGRYVMNGPMLAGQAVNVGPVAVIDTGTVDVIAMSIAGYAHDIAFFESVGIDVDDYDFVVVKSGNHFQLSFNGIATPLKVDTPGIGSYRPGFFEVHRPLVYPELENATFAASASFVPTS